MFMFILMGGIGVFIIFVKKLIDILLIVILKKWKMIVWILWSIGIWLKEVVYGIIVFYFVIWKNMI